ncbi:AAA family ATPase [Chitinophaga sp.]|uniref:AAA family ATPase n=1 Tax=Chitinophaga sp. TaxID=1869181 RepID=UPI0031D1BD47
MKRDTPRITYLKVKNYRVLENFELKDIKPLTVFLGPNGSGKSTIFDVFAFLSECFSIGLRKAWDKRGRFKELRTRGKSGPIEFIIKYRENLKSPLITYLLNINENDQGPFVEKEILTWNRHLGKVQSRPFKFLDFANGEGSVVSGDMPDNEATRVSEKLSSKELLAVNTLGQFASHPRVTALRTFITGWYLSYLSADNTKGNPEVGPQERLSLSGDNLPNVIQYLSEQHGERLDKILKILADRIPKLESVEAKSLENGMLLLKIKDAPFDQPILSKYASDGTLKMLAYLTLLYDPNPPALIGIEEPENQLHPRLLPELAEECKNASASAQMMITSHSPFFVNVLNPEELWVMYRNEKGYTQARRSDEMPTISDLVASGNLLGNLWAEGHFDVGDPLINEGGRKFSISNKNKTHK